MKEFIEHIQKSIYAPEYYRNILTRPASYAWKYYASLAMLLAVFMTITTTLPLLPKIQGFLKTLPETVMAVYPLDLVINIEKGVVSTNGVEPYYIDFPALHVEQASSSLLHLATIDTTSEVSMEQFLSYHSVFLLSQKSVVALDADEKLQIMSLGELTTVIDAPHVRSFLNSLQSYLVLVAPITVIVIFVGMCISFMAMLAYLLFDALLIYLMGKLLKEKWSYRDAYHLSLHAVTLPLLLSSVFYLLPISGMQFPFLSTALVLTVVYLNFRKQTVVLSELDKEG